MADKPISNMKFSPHDFLEVERLTATNPHAEDPRFLQVNVQNACYNRYQIYCRCTRELGDDDPRCKFSFYRAQIACPAEYIDMWQEHRERGKCFLDELPEKSSRLMP